MMRHSRLSLLWKLAFGLSLAVIVLLAGASVQQATETSDQLTKTYNAEPQRALGYWTEERMASARPMPLLEGDGVPFAPASFTPAGPPGQVPGTLPTTGRGAAAPMSAAEKMLDVNLQSDSGSMEPQIFGGTEWHTYPPPYTRYFPRFGNNLYPHRTLGKLFLADGLGGNFVCSAAAVTCNGTSNPSNTTVFATAGHCCADGAGNFFQDFLFVPACVGSSCATAPFGTWGWSSASVFTAWLDNGDFAVDVCFIEANSDLHGVVGSLGFAWNQTEPQQRLLTGWPAAAPFNGARLVFTMATVADLDGSETPNTVGMGTDMSPGSSGGAWIQKYKQGAAATNQFWNGLNSYKYTGLGLDQEMYGPTIDTAINTLRDFACTP